MRVLDLFCCAGGAAMGLHQAWPDAEIFGVDIIPQPRYPFNFMQGDALDASLEGYDFIWASPPCQAYSIAGIKYRQQGKEYPDLISATRAKLEASGLPWVMENVPGSPLVNAVVLCGSIFGLSVVRHRIFEANFHLGLVPPCQHGPETITVCGHGTPKWVADGRRKRGLIGNPTIADKRKAMGIDWTNRGELSQAVPPAYSRWIALQYFNPSTVEERQS
jgi:DNA (cytosine-5)-methyltransferase 1